MPVGPTVSHVASPPCLCDVQGWFLEVQGDDPQLVAALHKSITAKYHSMFGDDSHGKRPRRRHPPCGGLAAISGIGIAGRRSLGQPGRRFRRQT